VTLFILGCLLCVNSVIIVSGAQGEEMVRVCSTPAEGQFWVPVQYDLIQVPSYPFPQLILSVAALTAGAILVYEGPGGDESITQNGLVTGEQ